MAYRSGDNTLPNGPTLNRKTNASYRDKTTNDRHQEMLSQILTEVKQSNKMVASFQNEMLQLREGFENRFSQLFNLVYQLAVKDGVNVKEVNNPSLMQQEFNSLYSETELKRVSNDSGLYSPPSSLHMPSTQEENTPHSLEDDEQSMSSLHSGTQKHPLRLKSPEHSETIPVRNGQRDDDLNEERPKSQTTFQSRLDSLDTSISSEVQQTHVNTQFNSFLPSSPAVGDVIRRTNSLLLKGKGYKRRSTADVDDNRLKFFHASSDPIIEETQESTREVELSADLTSTMDDEYDESSTTLSVEARVKPMVREPVESEETIPKVQLTQQSASQGIIHNSSNTVTGTKGEPVQGPVPLEKQHLEELTLKEAQRAAECTDPKSDGADTIICIDTSDSMMGLGIQQAKKFITDFLDGVEECAVEHALEENIAIVTFGHTTRVIQHLTNDYAKIKDIVDDLEMGGPSPMMTGLVLCISAIYIRGGVVSFKNRKIMPRILLVSDGQVTDPRIMEGPDTSNPMGMSDEEARKQLIEFSERLKNEHRTVTCIPVGNADETVMKKLAEITGGEVVGLEGARRLSQQFLMNTIVARVLAEGSITPANSNRQIIHKAVTEQATAKQLSASEIDDVVTMITDELQSNPNATATAGGSSGEQGVLPPIGTRVRRGSDWIWEDQDDNMAGTITSHRQRGMVGVEWDSGRKGKFRYGADGSYDLRVVDEPRYLHEGELTAVGVKCTRGPDWEWDNQDGGEGSVGTVFKIEDNGIIHVRWENGKRGNYRFGLHDKYDIMMSPGNDGFSSGMSASGRSSSRAERVPEPVNKRPQWQWKDDKGVWQDHSPEASKKIEELFRKRQRGTTLVKCNGASYRVVIQSLNQRNTTTGQENQVRRIEVPDV